MARVLLVSQPTDGGVFRHVCDLAEGLPAHGFDVALAAPALTAPRRPTRWWRCRWSEPRRRATTRAPSRGSCARCARSVPTSCTRTPRRPAPWRGSRGSFAPRTPGRLHAARLRPRRLLREPGPATGVRAGRARADAARVADRLRLRGGAPARARSRRRPARAARLQRGRRPPAETAPHPEVAALRERGPVIATVTLLRPGKGIETLLDALPAVLAAHPGAQLAIAGAGVDRERLEARARALRRNAGGALPGLRPRDHRRAAGRGRVRLVLVGGVVPVRGPGCDGAGASDRRHAGRRRRRGGARRRVRAAGGAAETPGRSRGPSTGWSPTPPRPMPWAPARGRGWRRSSAASRCSRASRAVFRDVIS